MNRSHNGNGNGDLPTGPTSAGPAPVPCWKRTLDIACILVALPLLLPLMAMIALAVRIGSAGPVLFGQERVGHLGRRFRCLKFRSMIAGADTMVHQRHYTDLIVSNAPMVKMDLQGDPRLIPGGWWLRASGLDELPQIINVLRGDMSFVGPRPCLSYEYNRYLPWHKERFNTLPGLTGLWQVSGKNKTTFDEMMHLDIQYARNKSLWLDLKILLKTVPTVIIEIKNTRRGRKSFVERAQAQAVVSARTTNRSATQETVPVGYSNRLRDPSAAEDI
jgi:lipopolysaccharide/colanic/teichoic acid biosynthesis glycosyltransferase